jgi:ferrous-iron efflux pump FieF
MDETLPLAQHARLLKAATFAAVAVAVVLVIVKAAAYVFTGSVSILSTLIDSMLDVMASLVNLFAVHHALVPADAEHRFGHGKAEPIAGLAQAAFIIGSGAFLTFEAGSRFVHPRIVEHETTGVVVMIFAIVATIALVKFQRYVIRRTGSVAISADSLHYVSDVLINGSVIAALVIGRLLDLPWIDPLFGAAIALYIIYTAWHIVAQSVNLLMDRELSDAARARIMKIATAHPDVTAAHDLRTRSSGTHTFIQLHLEMNGDLTLTRAHEISDEVEAQIRAAFPKSEVIIHEDPDDITEERKRFS